MQDFLAQLHASGHITVLPFGLEKLAGEPSDTVAVLRHLDHEARREFPGEAPSFSWAVAHWAAETFYRACQLLVCRDVPADVTLVALRKPCPQPPAPETHYSVDLVFRFLPDLFGLAQRLAAGDALVDALRGLALAWPLSSVGVPGLGADGLQNLDALLGHRGLRTLYADRVVRHRDRDRLRDPRARAAVAAVLGWHADTFWPGFTKLETPGLIPALT